MKTLIIYYSYTGKTKALAKKLAQQEGADIRQIKDVEFPNKFKAYTLGCFDALRQKAWPTEPVRAILRGYDKIILMAPIWANKPAPQIYNVISTLPKGKDIEVIMVSGSGKSKSREKLTKRIEERGCKVISFKDVKGK